MDGFEKAVAYALQRLNSPDLQLKPEQENSLRALYSGKDTFVWLPTGFGKSLCYTALPFLYDSKLGRTASTSVSLTLVISPLVSLITDQVVDLRSKGVGSAVLTSESGRISRDLVASKQDLEKSSLLFCAPEALMECRWREILGAPAVSKRIVAVVIDEVHCVSKWSKDFRPAYGRLHEIRALVPQGTPFLACTATATRSIREEVLKSLEMVGCTFIHTSPDRPNIFYDVRIRTDIETDMQPIVNILTKYLISMPRMIVYCRSLNSCADLYAHFHHELQEKSYYPHGAEPISDNRLFAMFHANTPQHNKDVVLKSMTSPCGVVRIVFATVALGMGVNLCDVDTIIHYGSPMSIDDYFQESGRGGRSGNHAKSIVYWKPADSPVKKEPITTRDYEAIAVREYLQNCTTCRRAWLLNYFEPSCAKPGNDPKMCCDICAQEK